MNYTKYENNLLREQAPEGVLPLLRACIVLILILFSRGGANAQIKTDAFLENLLRSKATPLLTHVFNNADSFRYQLIYTQIDRDKNNRPHFKNYYFNADRTRYFNPASMVKLPAALLALEKLNELNIKGVNKYTAMLTDSGYEKQIAVLADTSSASGLPSVAHYIKKIFLVSDNDAYNRLYEFVGQERLNTGLWKKDTGTPALPGALLL